MKRNWCQKITLWRRKKKLHVKYKRYQHCIQINRTELFYISHNTFVNQQEHKNEYSDHGIVFLMPYKYYKRRYVHLVIVRRHALSIIVPTSTQQQRHGGASGNNTVWMSASLKNPKLNNRLCYEKLFWMSRQEIDKTVYVRLQLLASHVKSLKEKFLYLNCC